MEDSKRIVDYCIVIDDDSFKLANEVRKLMEKGWKTQSRVSAYVRNLGGSLQRIYAQAMIKYES